MNLTLPPELEALIRDKVDRGAYADATEVLQVALRLLDDRDRRDRLRAAIAVADAQIARGEVVPWTPDFIERLLAEANDEDRRGLPISDDVKP